MTTSFNKEKHEYLIDGKRATGVTTIIGVLAKPALIGWAAKCAIEFVQTAIASGLELTPELLNDAKNAHTKRKEAAGTHGTDAHASVEEWINLCLKSDGKPNFAMPHTTDIKKFVDWAVANVDHFIFSERQMFNKDLFIAGTADFAYVGKDGKKYMADFKTSSGIYGIDYWLQCAAYRMLAEAEGDTPYDGCTVVRLGKDGAFEVQQRFDYDTDKEAFLCCLKLYRAQATYIKPK